MKKLLCAAFIAVFVISCFVPGIAETAAVDAFLTQLSALMDTREAIYAQKRETLRAVGDFCDQRDYPSLLAARIACSDGVAELRKLTLPTMELSDEALMELMQMGVEVDTLEIEIRAMDTILTGEIDAMFMIQSMLYTAAYQNSQMDTLRDWVSLCEKRLDLDRAYDCSLLNVLLLPLTDNPAAMAFWNELDSRWPIICEARPAWEQDLTTLLKNADALMNEYAALAGEMSSALGRDAYDYGQFTNNMLLGDWEAMKSDAHAISDMPIMVPLPLDWLYPGTMSLSVIHDESGTDWLIMKEEGVSLTSFNNYIDLLTGLNIVEYQRDGSDEAGWTSILVGVPSPIVLRWMPGDIATAAYDCEQITLESYYYILCMLPSGENAGE